MVGHLVGSAAEIIISAALNKLGVPDSISGPAAFWVHEGFVEPVVDAVVLTQASNIDEIWHSPIKFLPDLSDGKFLSGFAGSLVFSLATKHFYGENWIIQAFAGALGSFSAQQAYNWFYGCHICLQTPEDNHALVIYKSFDTVSVPLTSQKGDIVNVDYSDIEIKTTIDVSSLHVDKQIHDPLTFLSCETEEAIAEFEQPDAKEIIAEFRQTDIKEIIEPNAELNTQRERALAYIEANEF
jgi:hypothetical protein